MTNRLNYPEYWAQDGEALDPDLDTTAPSYIPDRYETVGWEAEKPPEQWQNFLTQITDVKIREMLLGGILQWCDTVTYSLGAFALVDGKIYQKREEIPGNISPPTSGSGWQEVLETNLAQYNAKVQYLKNMFNAHMAEQNPHKDTVDTIVDGTYLQDYVYDRFASDERVTTIPYHISRTGASVHRVTPAQLNTLPTSGGTFSGPVVFLQEAYAGTGVSQYIHRNDATGIFEIVNGTFAIGVDSGGKAWYIDSTGSYEVLTEANYDAFNIKYGNSFALPARLMSANFRADVSDAESTGQWWVETASTPVFTNGGYKIDDNAMTMFGCEVVIPCTVVSVVVLSTGAVSFGVWDATSFNYPDGFDVKSVLEAALFPGQTISVIRYMAVYPRLSDNQRSMLTRQ
ncbi:tail fiber protein [Yersinia phage PYps23T]|uniref:Tail fiber protein n=1 Tax=Yersinia phage PYps23T TaxID=2801356 RepID=A0AAE7PDE4_9CAUD|nr:tail fiber protein [Yersinia phage PYps23T]QQO90993.1 tail fiber protein [Yersinia phage PYps23T]